MRAMRQGDMAFFYASGGAKGRTPGITGIMEVVSEHEPDPSVHDEGSYGYVEKEKDRGKWCIVKVEFRKKLSVPVGLKELQKYATGALGGMQVLKMARLSVSAVTEGEWNFIVNNLITGYEDDNSAKGQAGKKITKDTDGDVDMDDADLPNAPAAASSEPTMPTTETDAISSDALPSATSVTTMPRSSSRPGKVSRQGSKAPSAAGSRPVSKSRGSLAANGTASSAETIAGTEAMAVVTEEVEVETTTDVVMQ